MDYAADGSCTEGGSLLDDCGCRIFTLSPEGAAAPAPRRAGGRRALWRSSSRRRWMPSALGRRILDRLLPIPRDAIRGGCLRPGAEASAGREDVRASAGLRRCLPRRWRREPSAARHLGAEPYDGHCAREAEPTLRSHRHPSGWLPAPLAGYFGPRLDGCTLAARSCAGLGGINRHRTVAVARPKLLADQGGAFDAQHKPCRTPR